MTTKTYKRGKITVWHNMTLRDLEDIVAKAKSLGIADDDKLRVSSGTKRTVDEAVTGITHEDTFIPYKKN